MSNSDQLTDGNDDAAADTSQRPASIHVEFVQPLVLHALRRQVLRPGQPWSSVDHDYDSWPDTFHVAAFGPRGEVAGCASFHPDAAPHRPGRLAPPNLAPSRDGVAARGAWSGLRRRGPALRDCRGTPTWRHRSVVQREIGCGRLLREARILHRRRRVRDRADRAALRHGDRAMSVDILRYSAFTDTPAGGNPAGIVLDATGLDESTMQAIAAEVGYSETAFLTVAGDDGRSFDIRYFAPSIEVPFCGHATIATGVALGERLGPRRVLAARQVRRCPCRRHPRGRWPAARNVDQRRAQDRRSGGRRPRRTARRARLEPRRSRSAVAAEGCLRRTLASRPSSGYPRSACRSRL